jgi:hypothetical protein
VTIEAAEGVHLRFARSAIGRVIHEQPKDPVDEDDEDDDVKKLENG